MQVFYCARFVCLFRAGTVKRLDRFSNNLDSLDMFERSVLCECVCLSN